MSKNPAEPDDTPAEVYTTRRFKGFTYAQAIYPLSGPPVRTRYGWAGYVQRLLVATSYRSTTPTDHCPADVLWLKAVTRRYADVDMLLKQGYSDRLNARLERLRRCSPPGYVHSYHDRDALFCGSRECPFCHARRVAAHIRAVDRCFDRRPKGSPFYAGVLRGDGDVPVMRAAVRASRCAGAVGFVYPRRFSDGVVTTTHKAILFSDDRKRLRGHKPREVFTAVDLTRLLTTHLRYPYGGLSDDPDHRVKAVLRACLEVPKKSRNFTVYGACAAGDVQWVPGKTWFDFAAFEVRA